MKGRLQSWTWQQCQAPKFLRRDLFSLSLASKIGLLPLDIDPQSLTMTTTKSVLKKSLFLFLMTLHFFVACYLVATFVLLMKLPGNLRIDDAVIHVIILTSHIANLLVANQYFFQHSSLLCSIANTLHKLGHEWSDLPISARGITKQKLVLAVLYWALPVGVTILVVFCIQDPARMMNMYYLYDQTGLPTSTKDWMVYASSSLILSMSIFALTPAIFCVYTHVLGLEYFNAKMAKELDLIRNSHRKTQMANVHYVEGFLRRLHIHQLSLQQFNQVNADTVFYIKQLQLCAGILGWFAFIAFFGQNVITGIGNITIAIYSTLAFAINYEKAFLIPLEAEELKRDIVSAAAGHQVHEGKMAIYKKELKSIRNDGIRVGGFTVMERTSTPEFVELVTTTVASLLLTFRQV